MTSKETVAPASRTRKPADERWYDGGRVTKAEIAAELTAVRAERDRLRAEIDALEQCRRTFGA